MNYKVLYRKYRPNSFDEIIDQDVIVKILQNSINNDKISHAYIFSGPRGTGKTSLARIFAKNINCKDIKNGKMCGKCDICCNLDNPDIIEIDAASNNGVEEIREIINNVKIMPIMSKYKVYIIDEVHMLTNNAFNALLLTLEEPPKHVIFILATTNIENVPITILSRCQKFEFNKIDSNSIVNHLKKICKEEKIDYTSEGLKEISLLSDGGLRDALSLLDQLSKENIKITADYVIKESGSVSDVFIKKFISNFSNNDVKSLIAGFNELKKSNINYKIFIKKLINLLSEEAVNILLNNESSIEYSTIKNICLELNTLINQINININPYTLIELVILNHLSSAKNIECEQKIDIIKENNEINNKKDVKINNKVSNVKTNVCKINCEYIEAIINNCFTSATKQHLKEKVDQWNTFVNCISDKQLKGLLLDCIPVASNDFYTIIVTNIESNLTEINNLFDKIEKLYKKYFENKKMVILTENMWGNEKNKYLKNLKDNKKYEYIDEKLICKYNNVESKEKNVSEFEIIANNIFDNSKIEIE